MSPSIPSRIAQSHKVVFVRRPSLSAIFQALPQPHSQLGCAVVVTCPSHNDTNAVALPYPDKRATCLGRV